MLSPDEIMWLLAGYLQNREWGIGEGNEESVRENASLEESDDVTILLFRLKIAKNRRKKIWALKQSLILGFHRSISFSIKASLSNVP